MSYKIEEWEISDVKDWSQARELLEDKSLRVGDVVYCIWWGVSEADGDTSIDSDDYEWSLFSGHKSREEAESEIKRLSSQDFFSKQFCGLVLPRWREMVDRASVVLAASGASEEEIKHAIKECVECDLVLENGRV